MIRGWCLHDLGRPNSAAEVIGRQLDQVPKRAVRSQVRYGVRRALACAAAGEVDQACQLTAELLDSALSIGSATVAVDLRKLARSLARHPLNESVRDLAPIVRGRHIAEAGEELLRVNIPQTEFDLDAPFRHRRHLTDDQSLGADDFPISETRRHFKRLDVFDERV